MEPILIITRHTELVEFIKKELRLSGEVVPHATEEMVKGREVIGVLPLHLAAVARSITSIDLDVAPNLRGKELTYDQIKQAYKGCTTYVVRSVDDHNKATEAACLSAMQGGAWDYIPAVRCLAY